jgi:hypothetical protein
MFSAGGNPTIAVVEVAVIKILSIVGQNSVITS